MLTNRRSTMMMPPARTNSWHPQPKPVPHQTISTLSTFDSPVSREPSILTTTTSSLPGHRVVRVLGAVHGTTSFARKDRKSFIKSIASGFGSSWGEAKSVTSLLYQARDQAVDRMVSEAVSKGANAIIGLDVRESEVLGCVVVSVSGTACYVERGAEVYKDKRDSAQETGDPFE